MPDFIIRFFICNIFLTGITRILLAARQIFKNCLSIRMQCSLWFLFLGLLAVPFIPLRFPGFPQIFSWIGSLQHTPVFHFGSVAENTGTSYADASDWMNNFALSVNTKTPAFAGYLLFGIWSAGIFIMILFFIKSSLSLRAVEKSALLLQNSEVRKLYRRCLKETNISKNIPVYSTAFFTSPVISGMIKPRIYLPIHLISNYQESEVRYMLLHELQHYKHKDVLVNHLASLAAVIYWFHPLVRYVLKEMRNDREIACDTSVLEMLEEKDYKDYGNTLINFAEKISLSAFPFTAGLGGSSKQIGKRIIHIASYQKPTRKKSLKGISAFILTAALLFGFTPFLSTYAANNSYYQWNTASEHIVRTDLSAYFKEYEGSFVLYDSKNASWDIYNMKHALRQVSPDSTWKIYDALLALEKNVISPEDSSLAWDRELYPFDAWNTDQTLPSAMAASVNWYFQALDEQIGTDALSGYIKTIGYGNQHMNGNLSSYWMKSSLKISPVEQVELLRKLHENDFHAAPENIHTVKDAIRLSSSDTETFYGKTGTGRVNGKDINGWFVGFVETADNTYYFAANINADSSASGSSTDSSASGSSADSSASGSSADSSASGSSAARLTMSVLEDRNIWKP